MKTFSTTRRTITAAAAAAVLCLAAVPDRAQAQDPGDHVGAYNFRVEIDGIAAGNFVSIDGLSMEIEVVEFQVGDETFVRKRPGRTKFSNVTLKRGYTATDDLFQWWRSAAEGTPLRRTVSIVLLDPMTGADVVGWDLINAWPKSWKISSSSGKGTDVAIEEIVLAVEEIRLQPLRE